MDRYHGYATVLHNDISETDPEMADLIKEESTRQRRCLNLVASENLVSRAVMHATGSILTNKYADGKAGSRCYVGCENVDKIEFLTKKRALELFGLDPDTWGVNVQAYSGCPANMAVFTALVGVGGRIMGLDVVDGGHPSHGSNIIPSATSTFFTTMSYKLDAITGLVDYKQLLQNTKLFNPKLIIAGTSSYTRHLNYRKFREVADLCGALLMADMAHVSGLVAAGVSPSPFEHCDLVTTTTHKTMAGPRGAMIYYKKGFEEQINNAIFPVLQGGPHCHTIAAIGVAVKQASLPEFKEYQRQVVKNAKHLCEALEKHGYTIAAGGTDNHIVLVDLVPSAVSSSIVEAVLERMSITVNKRRLSGSGFGGIRLGTTTITARGLRDDHIDTVSNLINEGIKLASTIQAAVVVSQSGSSFEEMRRMLINDPEMCKTIDVLRNEVESFMAHFPMPV